MSSELVKNLSAPAAEALGQGLANATSKGVTDFSSLFHLFLVFVVTVSAGMN